jgi:hypothetical protein
VSLDTDIAEFREKLRFSHEKFRPAEQMIREQYARDSTPDGLISDMLERPTRRFLIDEMLKALDWNPDEPHQVAEEARSWSSSGARLYFDYLGISRDNAPVLLVEAKGFDVPEPRRPKGDPLSAAKMPGEIARAINDVRAAKKKTPLIANWTEILQDLHGYIASLDELGLKTLKRAVITAGRWVIVFTDPVATFRTGKSAEGEHITCFLNFTDQLQGADELYRLLHRSMLIDTLPLTLDVNEALRIIRADQIGDCYRAVLVTTTSVGGSRRPVPFRLVYPALLVASRGRWYAIVDYHDNYATEPRSDDQDDQFEPFLADLERRGSALEIVLDRMYGRSFAPLPLSSFPGFTPKAVTTSIFFPPIEGSTEARRRRDDRPTLVVTGSGEHSAHEHIVVTGTDRFYKAHTDGGLECGFHYWKKARTAGGRALDFRDRYEVNSFTVDGQQRHCAHGHLVSIRSERCHLRALESQLCCQACIFRHDCWKADAELLPCERTPAS